MNLRIDKAGQGILGGETTDNGAECYHNKSSFTQHFLARLVASKLSQCSQSAHLCCDISPLMNLLFQYDVIIDSSRVFSMPRGYKYLILLGLLS